MTENYFERKNKVIIFPLFLEHVFVADYYCCIKKTAAAKTNEQMLKQKSFQSTPITSLTFKDF